MLQLRTTGVLSRHGNKNFDQHAAFHANARSSMLRVCPAQQSKVGFRGSSLALQAHRGDEVAAFLVATDSKEAGEQADAAACCSSDCGCLMLLLLLLLSASILTAAVC
jgi:hypothetical protein